MTAPMAHAKAKQARIKAEFLSLCVHSTTEMLGLRRSVDARNALTAFSYLSQARFA
jgi:hypothetical protein